MRGDLDPKSPLEAAVRELVQGDLAEGHVREDLGPNPAANTLVMARRPSCAERRCGVERSTTHLGTAGRTVLEEHTDDVKHREAAVPFLRMVVSMRSPIKFQLTLESI